MKTASGSIAKKISALNDWRDKILKEFRQIIRVAAPDVIEEIKWKKPSNSMLGVPVWSQNGIICTGEIYKDKVKFTFANGASLKDSTGIFNSSLEGNTRRAIDILAGDKLDKPALKNLILEAVALNLKKKK